MNPALCVMEPKLDGRRQARIESGLRCRKAAWRRRSEER
jgi:hypothetical protein